MSIKDGVFVPIARAYDNAAKYSSDLLLVFKLFQYRYIEESTKPEIIISVSVPDSCIITDGNDESKNIVHNFGRSDM